MKIRRFAAVLLAPVILSGCDREPMGAPAPLLGGWQSDAMHLTGTAPNGSTNLVRREQRLFEFDGSYARYEALFDVTTGRTWIMAAERGSWRANDTELRLTIRETFSVDPARAVDVPAWAPVDPRVVRTRYELRDETLVIEGECNAVCVLPLPLPLHRVPVLF